VIYPKFDEVAPLLEGYPRCVRNVKDGYIYLLWAWIKNAMGLGLANHRILPRQYALIIYSCEACASN
jgi:hypothetical protein